MIKSMTGFGRGESITEQCRITVEIKAVNHRYCDINIKLPKRLNALESLVRDCIKNQVSRGKLDVYIGYEDLSGEISGVKLNESLGREYVNVLTKISELYNLPDDVTTMKFARLPELITLSETGIDENTIKDQLLDTVKDALNSFEQAKTKEGEALKNDILLKLEIMKSNVTKVEERYPAIIEEYRNRLENKVKELLEATDIEESRIACEVVMYADKICVDEETVRLKTHIEHMKEELLKGKNVGRKLDFIAQEMNREANTILSKANDITITDAAIELKTDIEKIREQVQNIE